MNAIFIVILVISVIMIMVVSPDAVVGAMITGGLDAVTLSLKMLAIYAVWTSVLKIMEKTGINKLLTRAFLPLTRRLFKGESDKAIGYITLNLASNMLGLGGAATLAGIEAIKEMDKGDGRATKNMVMLTVIAATSIQLLPATVISLMASAGSAAPSAIILPSIISTAVSTLVGVILTAVFVK